jgi:VanZ family protein
MLPHIFGKHRLGLNLSFLRDWDFLGSWLPPLFWCGAILAFSGGWGSANNTQIILNWLLSWFTPLSLTRVELLHYFLRKTGHAVAYGFLYFLWFRAFWRYQGYPFWRAFLWSLALCLAVAGLDEGHQSLFTCRSSSIRDVALDMGGASLSALITSIIWIPQAGRQQINNFSNSK